MENQINNLLNAALRGNYEGARRIADLLIADAKKEGKKDFAARLQASVNEYDSFAGGSPAILDNQPQHPLADIFNPGRIRDPKQVSCEAI